MNKTIVLLSGTPSGKAKFDEVCKGFAWVWNLNLKNTLGSQAKSYGWNGEKDEKYYAFVGEFLSLLNKHFDYEHARLTAKIQDFLEDEDEIKFDDSGKGYENFVLILHGVGRDVAEKLKDEQGVYKIRISSRPPVEEEVKEREWGDFVLYEDDDNYSEQIVKLMLGLLGK